MNYDQFNPSYDPNNDPAARREEVRKHATKFRAARHTLFLVATLTAINVILGAAGSDIGFLFSAPIPAWAFVLLDFTSGTGIALVASFSLIAIYVVLAVTSKNNRGLITVALFLFCLETIIVALLCWLTMIGDGILNIRGLRVPLEADIWFVIELVICIWILFTLIVGTISWSRLKGIPSSELEHVYKDIDASTGGTVQWDTNAPPPPAPAQFNHLPPDSPPNPQMYNPNPQEYNYEQPHDQNEPPAY
jgi:hypothetical protein